MQPLAPPSSLSDPLDFLDGGGRMGAAIRVFDWSATSLGRPEIWPLALKTVTRLVLSSGQPMCFWWGAELRQLHNDAYLPMLGARSAVALGAPFRELWADAWDGVAPFVERAMRGEGTWAEDLPLVLTRNGYEEQTYFTFSYSPLHDDAGTIRGLLNIVTETTRGVLAQRQAATERQRMAQMFEQAPSFMALLRGPEHVLEMINPGYQQLIGERDVLGRTVAEALPDAVAQGYLNLLDKAYASGEAVRSIGARYAVQAEANGPIAEHYLDFVFQPIRDPDGQVTGVFVEGSDVTERVLAEHRRDTLTHELSHRMKNTLAMVQAIVSQSLRHASSIADAGQLASERIQALGRAQDTLTDTNWQAADVRDVVEAAVAPHRDAADRFTLRGPKADLDAQRAMGLSLALHELATNATKYGALSIEAGHVALTWDLSAEGAFCFEWREEGGPAAKPPERKGFGSRLTERVVAGYFRGSAATDYRPGGVVYRLEGTL